MEIVFMSRTTRALVYARSSGWVRFLVGVIVLGSCIAFFASGYSPPGALGEVLRHNQQHDIDASPLFYSEVENMRELEAGLAELMNGTGDRGGNRRVPSGENQAKRCEQENE
jgi:hypothetical protein